jgi:hypothetical protein
LLTVNSSSGNPSGLNSPRKKVEEKSERIIGSPLNIDLNVKMPNEVSGKK